VILFYFRHYFQVSKVHITFRPALVL